MTNGPLEDFLMKPVYPDITKSNALWEKAKKIIPAGTQTLSKSPNQFVEGVTPKYLERGDGCFVWDVDGNRFIDYSMACHPIILGYNNRFVNAAVIEQLEKGIVFSLMNPLEVEVTEKLIDMVPCCEGARFGKNGADATSAAIRLSRAYTGRDHIAYCGYHGWHDWYIANTDLNSGIPKFNNELSHPFAYNQISTLEQVFSDFKEQIACVIMEPVTVIEPQKGFLEDVKRLTHENGAVLVFDEIITGFRFAEGGAQELFGVIPDVACFAKAMSNGMPVSAVTGKAEYINMLEKTFFSFTYGGECLSLAAAKATLNYIRENKVIQHLWEVGKTLQDGINGLADERGVKDFIQCIGYPCRSVLSFNGMGRFDELELKSLFQQEMIKRGVLSAGYHSISYSHTTAVIEKTLTAYEESMNILKKIIDRGLRIADVLDGPAVQPVFRKVSDFMSYMTKKKNN
jgi:glutamate-1-semialdehyde 2,1-aminomutase/spore coat polysaccharide biosynthesis protein SpsF